MIVIELHYFDLYTSNDSRISLGIRSIIIVTLVKHRYSSWCLKMLAKLWLWMYVCVCFWSACGHMHTSPLTERKGKRHQERDQARPTESNEISTYIPKMLK